MHPVAMQRVNECGKFPAAKVRGEKKHAFSPSHRSFVILKAVIDHYTVTFSLV